MAPPVFERQIREVVFAVKLATSVKCSVSRRVWLESDARGDYVAAFSRIIRGSFVIDPYDVKRAIFAGFRTVNATIADLRRVQVTENQIIEQTEVKWSIVTAT